MKVCAIHIRGGMRCAWCGAKYRGRNDASVDHLDGDPSNNDSTNLVSSCIGCNSSRAHDWEAGTAWTAAEARRTHCFGKFDFYLLGKLVDVDAGIRRAQQQRVELLDMVAGRKLARKWYPNYRDACNRANRAYKWRKTPEGQAELARVRAVLYGGKTLAEVS